MVFELENWLARWYKTGIRGLEMMALVNVL